MAEPCSSTRIFLPTWDYHNKPSKIVTLGHYYPQGKISDAKSVLRQASRDQHSPNDAVDTRVVRDHIAWTRLINALNLERQWPLKRLCEMLDPMLEPGIAIAVVPPHRAYQAFWPMRTLAQELAADRRRGI